MAGLVAVIAVVAGIGAVVYQVYFKTADSGPVRAVASVLGFPAAKVGTYTVSYKDYVETMDAIRKFVKSDAGKTIGEALPPDDQLKQNVMDRLLKQAMVQEAADQRKLTVADDDVRKVFADVVRSAASSSIPDVAQYLYQNYGWNEEQFRQKILRPALLEQKLAVEMSKEKEGDANALETYLAERRAKSDVVVYLQMK